MTQGEEPARRPAPSLGSLLRKLQSSLNAAVQASKNGSQFSQSDVDLREVLVALLDTLCGSPHGTHGGRSW